MLLGITGQIGAGKTTAAKILASFGAHVIDADLIGRRVVDESPAVLNALVIAFGDTILTKSGKLSRTKLARVAFVDTQNKKQLDKIVHPHLLRELRRDAFTAAKNHSIVLIDAALLLDWGMDREVDHVLLIHAPTDIRTRRLLKRGMKREDVLARQKSQLPLKEYRRRAKSVINNDGSQFELKRKLGRFYKRLISM